MMYTDSDSGAQLPLNSTKLAIGCFILQQRPGDRPGLSRKDGCTWVDARLPGFPDIVRFFHHSCSDRRCILLLRPVRIVFYELFFLNAVSGPQLCHSATQG